MTECNNCGKIASISDGACTEETGRLCEECADDTNWKEYVDFRCRGCDTVDTRDCGTAVRWSASMSPDMLTTINCGYVCDSCIEKQKWQTRMRE